MRTATHDIIIAGNGNHLLTTGEAAKILNSSRQHVVDLCERGELPFVTIGTHRRVRQSDIDAMQTRTVRLTRDQERSLWIAYAVAGHIVQNSSTALGLARNNLKVMRQSSRGQARIWLDEWEKLVDGPVEDLLAMLTSRSPKARELRQNSPFSGLLTEEQRNQVLDAWKSLHTERTK
ncbi:MAG: helix-turn-helix domain-containing protein [Ilumatobacteraceae bacterium]